MPRPNLTDNQDGEGEGEEEEDEEEEEEEEMVLPDHTIRLHWHGDWEGELSPPTAAAAAAGGGEGRGQGGGEDGEDGDGGDGGPPERSLFAEGGWRHVRGCTALGGRGGAAGYECAFYVDGKEKRLPGGSTSLPATPREADTSEHQLALIYHYANCRPRRGRQTLVSTS